MQPDQYEGHTIEHLDNKKLGADILNTLRQEKDYSWLLAYCSDGVVWGKHDQQTASWSLSSDVFGDLCPVITKDNLLQVHLFGNQGELLIWREGDGFSGRDIRDTEPVDRQSPTRPGDEVRVLFGDRMVAISKGFTRVSTATGIEQAVPIECQEEHFKDGRWPLRLKIRNYFNQDPVSGAVRVAASRLVRVYLEEK